MNKANPVSAFVHQVAEWLRRLGSIVMVRFFSKKRPPELQELEDQFTKDMNSDPEKVRDRQVSATIRSGRG